MENLRRNNDNGELRKQQLLAIWGGRKRNRRDASGFNEKQTERAVSALLFSLKIRKVNHHILQQIRREQRPVVHSRNNI